MASEFPALCIPGATVLEQRLAEPQHGYYVNPDGREIRGLPTMRFLELALSAAKGSFIRVEIALPENAAWNGRLVGCGAGGAGGRLPTRDVCAYARRGFAAATTDLGTSRPSPALAGVGNPEVWRDFGHRATHLMALAADAAVRAAYGRAPSFRYFVGASTGGQQAFSLAQRHPADFDGILATVPAHRRTPLHAYFLWNWQATHRPDGSPLFTRTQERSYRAVVLDLLSARETFPHARSRFLSDPRWDAALRDEAIRRAAAHDPSLTPVHLDALRRLQDGPVHARTGERLFDGLPPASEFAPASDNLYLLRWVFGPDADLAHIDFHRDIDRYFATLSPDLDAENPDLAPFRDRGGKLLAIAGTADSCVPCSATIDYYERVVGHLGGDLAAVQDFFLLYLLPGRRHMGGPGVQSLRGDFRLLMDWREKGRRPRAEGVACAAPAFRVPLYPYPETTAPDGSAAPFPRGGVVPLPSLSV